MHAYEILNVAVVLTCSVRAVQNPDVWNSRRASQFKERRQKGRAYRPPLTFKTALVSGEGTLTLLELMHSEAIKPSDQQTRKTG